MSAGWVMCSVCGDEYAVDVDVEELSECDRDSYVCPVCADEGAEEG